MGCVSTVFALPAECRPPPSRWWAEALRLRLPIRIAHRPVPQNAPLPDSDTASCPPGSRSTSVRIAGKDNAAPQRNGLLPCHCIAGSIRACAGSGTHRIPDIPAPLAVSLLRPATIDKPASRQNYPDVPTLEKPHPSPASVPEGASAPAFSPTARSLPLRPPPGRIPLSHSSRPPASNPRDYFESLHPRSHVIIATRNKIKALPGNPSGLHPRHAAGR